MRMSRNDAEAEGLLGRVRRRLRLPRFGAYVARMRSTAAPYRRRLARRPPGAGIIVALVLAATAGAAMAAAPEVPSPQPNRPGLARPGGRAMPPGVAPSTAATAARRGPSAAAGPADFEFRIDRGRLSADVGQVPVADVLTRLARDTGAAVLVRGDLGTTRPQSFSDVALLDGLERLVAPNHLVVEFGPDRGDIAPRLLRIRVFGMGAALDRSPEPLALAAAAGGAAASQPAARLAPALDGRLGWSYGDAGKLPPLPMRVRRIGGIYAASGEGGMAALRSVIESDPDPAARSAAVRAAAGFPYDDAMPLLQQALTDAHPEVRLATIAAMNPPPDQPPTFLVDVINNAGEDERVRFSALELLGRFRLDEQVGLLLQEIAATDHPRISAAARGMLAIP